jgi:hypothetical protein
MVGTVRALSNRMQIQNVCVKNSEIRLRMMTLKGTVIAVCIRKQRNKKMLEDSKMNLSEILHYAELGAQQSWLNNNERIRDIENNPELSKDEELLAILKESSSKYYADLNEIRMYLSGERSKDYSYND